MDYFVFAGVDSSNFGVWLSGEGTFNVPARRYTSIEVPGRNGNLTLNEDPVFEDVIHTYPAFIARTFQTNVKDLRNELARFSGKQRLTDSYHPGEYYRAEFVEALEVEVAPRAVAGRFEIRFRRDPRRFLVSGETAITLTASGSVTNPTKFKSMPLLRVYGNGTVRVGSNTITLADTGTYTDIDCEMMEAYEGTASRNANVTFSQNDFPKLSPGANGITIGSGITKVEITPRWWII